MINSAGNHVDLFLSFDCVFVQYPRLDHAQSSILTCDIVRFPPPSTMQGPKLVVITEGRIYAACGKNARLSDVCDHGAVAVDAEDGVMDEFVTACSPDGMRFKFSKKGLQGCNLDTSVPGLYNITFLVIDSAGSNASAIRQVKVSGFVPVHGTI